MIVPIVAGRQIVRVAALWMTVSLLILPRDDAACWLPHRQDKAEPSWPMFGGSSDRNMVNAIERKLPDDWCIEDGKRKNIKWVAELGDQTIGSPVVAHGKVFVATNNAKPRDPEVPGPKAVLMAFRESDGQFLWQIAHDIPAHWGRHAIGALPSTPAVVGGHLYYVTSAGELICADAERGRIQWRFDMRQELNVHPYHGWCPAAVAPPWSSPLVVGDLVFAATGNGVDAEGKLVSPRAPSFIALDKRTGKLVWQSNLPGENKASALVWAFGGRVEPLPERGPRGYFGPTVSTAAVHQGLVYITEERGYLHCLDAATGIRIWVYDLAASLNGSPYLVDGRVFVGTEDGEVLIFSHQRAARVRATIDMDERICTTPVAANGTLYVATKSKLFAIGSR